MFIIPTLFDHLRWVCVFFLLWLSFQWWNFLNFDNPVFKIWKGIQNKNLWQMYLVSNVLISLLQVPAHSPLQTFKFQKASNILFLAIVSSTFPFNSSVFLAAAKPSSPTYPIVYWNIFASTVLNHLPFKEDMRHCHGRQ